MKEITSYQSILAHSQKEIKFNADHPLFYIKEKHKYLERLSQQVGMETELPTVDLRRNMRIDHHLQQYNLINQQQLKAQQLKNSLLKTQNYNSILQQDEIDRRKSQKQTKKNIEIQQSLYKHYIQQIQEQPTHQHQSPNSPYNQPHTVLTMDNNKELYLLDLQIGRLKEEERLDKVVKERGESCRNDKLISKLSSNIISSYMVYFDDIFALLMDEMLEEEVIHLNAMEADYRVNGNEKKNKNGSKDLGHQKGQNRQTIKMMQLVKSLEDLCDQ